MHDSCIIYFFVNRLLLYVKLKEGFNIEFQEGGHVWSLEIDRYLRMNNAKGPNNISVIYDLSLTTGEKGRY